jgi:hypothetical protein
VNADGVADMRQAVAAALALIVVLAPILHRRSPVAGQSLHWRDDASDRHHRITLGQRRGSIGTTTAVSARLWRSPARRDPRGLGVLSSIVAAERSNLNQGRIYISTVPITQR